MFVLYHSLSVTPQSRLLLSALLCTLRVLCSGAAAAHSRVLHKEGGQHCMMPAYRDASIATLQWSVRRPYMQRVCREAIPECIINGMGARYWPLGVTTPASTGWEARSEVAPPAAARRQ